MKRFILFALLPTLILLFGSACFAQAPVDQTQTQMSPAETPPTWEEKRDAASQDWTNARTEWEKVRGGVEAAEKRIQEAETALADARAAKDTAQTDANAVKAKTKEKALAYIAVIQSYVDDLDSQ